MDKKPAKFSLFVGVSAPSIQPDDYGTTYEDQSSYGMWSYGGVMAAGQLIISDITKLPASSITQADLLEQRERGTDKMLSAGDEVVLLGAQGNDRITAEEIGDWLGTINYEVVTSLRHVL